MDGTDRTSLIARAPDLRGRPLWGAALAVSLFGAATVARGWLHDSLPPGFPFLTFFPAVVVSAYVAGWRAGVLCAALSTLAAWYLFIPPIHSWSLTYATAVALGFFVIVVGVMIAVIHRMQQLLDGLAAEREVSTRLIESQRTMFQELQHRVANNMMFVASVLQLHRKSARAGPEQSAQALDEAYQRIQLMSRIHRRLYDPSSVNQPVDQYFRDMGHDLLEATGARNIVLLVDMPEMRLDMARLMTLSLIITEIVTNSLKHAFTDRERGTITLSMERAGPGRMALTVADDGVGMARAEAGDTGSGLGRRIVDALAGQLGGRISVESRPGLGTATRLNFATA